MKILLQKLIIATTLVEMVVILIKKITKVMLTCNNNNNKDFRNPNSVIMIILFINFSHIDDQHQKASNAKE